MRTTPLPFLCSIAMGCAPLGGGGYGNDDVVGPDAGAEGSNSTACTAMESKTTDLTISGSSSFSNLPKTCWRLVGKLTVTGTNVSSLTALNDLREVNELVIDNTALTKFDTKSAITVNGPITIKSNNQLTDVANIIPAANLPWLVVDSNAQLTSLGGLSKAVAVAGPVQITNNQRLQAASLGSLTQAYTFIVQDNSSVTSIDVHSLQTVQDYVTIRHNFGLTSVGDWTALQYIHGALTIDDNDSLTDLSSLTKGPQAIEGNLYITNNALLRELGGISHTSQIGTTGAGTISLLNNPALPGCEVREIDCCVRSGAIYQSGNLSTESQCNVTGYSWCWNNGCPY